MDTVNSDVEFIKGIKTVWTGPLAARHIDTPTGIQKLVIPRILEKKDVLFRSATGTGKTLAYLLPLLQHIADEKNADGGGTSKCGALILAPTLELCAQIKHEADYITHGTKQPVSVVLLAGGVNSIRQKTEIRRLKPDIIIGNSNRVLELAAERKLKLSGIRYLVLDEADRLAAPESLESVRALVSILPKRRTNIACSATFSPRIREQLGLLTGAIFDFIETDGHEILRSLITHWAIWSERRRRVNVIMSLLASLRIKRALIFAGTAEEAVKINGQLQYNKISAQPLYSGQRKNERKQALESFREGSITALIATDLAARGLDIPDITHVISAGVPESSDTYIHRAGRTARAGKQGICVSIGDEVELRRLLAIEKKLGITIYPKELYGGKLYAPAELDAAGSASTMP